VIVSWFSCGCNSAVATKLALDLYPGEVTVARCIVDNEHQDNERFHADCARWFGQPILRLASTEYADCWEVWEKRRYISGVKGAPCTVEMKKAVRWEFERKYNPAGQVFGFSADEKKRADRFREQNPEVNLLTPLIDAGITKADCAIMVEFGEMIELPVMYKLGFKNNNCIACAKATSIAYWARTRHFFPAEFNRMAELSRRLGCRLTRLHGHRIFIDEIPADYDWQKRDRSDIDCGLWCGDAA
jgi:hypothetical protein